MSEGPGSPESSNPKQANKHSLILSHELANVGLHLTVHACPFRSSVSVYYVAVRTIVLSRHGSNLARPVIIYDIIHGSCMNL